MNQKHPAWTRSRAGRNRVHWVAYDDRGEGRKVVDQGYAATLAGADAAARSALAEAGFYQARRMPSGPVPPPRVDRAKVRRPARADAPGTSRPREYLYTRRQGDRDEPPVIAAHLVLKKTAKKVHVTRRSCGPDQLGTADEAWGEGEPSIALDRGRLERDGSAPSVRCRFSDFYATRERAMGGPAPRGHAPLEVLGIRAPCTVEDIKEAYRRRAFQVHPDRGGTPGEFRAVEDAYRLLLREARATGP